MFYIKHIYFRNVMLNKILKNLKSLENIVKDFCLADRNLFFSGEVLWASIYHIVYCAYIHVILDYHYI
jgi:hypothetical protein